MYLDESDFEFDEASGDAADGSHCVCDHCGEEFSINVDFSQGAFQQFVQDCPVCWNPQLISVEIDNDGNAYAFAKNEN